MAKVNQQSIEVPTNFAASFQKMIEDRL